MLANKAAKHWILMSAAAAFSMVGCCGLPDQAAATGPSIGGIRVFVSDENPSVSPAPALPGSGSSQDELDGPSEDGTDVAPQPPETDDPPGCPYQPFPNAHPSDLLI